MNPAGNRKSSFGNPSPKVRAPLPYPVNTSLRAPKERGNLGVVEFIPSNKTEIAQPVPSAAKNPALHNDK